MSYKNQDQCLKKAFDNEMLFVLMARDETAPAVIMEWIKLNLGKQPKAKLIEALECAIEMERTRETIKLQKDHEKLFGKKGGEEIPKGRFHSGQSAPF